MNLSIIISAAILLIGLLYCEKREIRKTLVVTKTLLSFLFILAAAVQPHPLSRYYYFILTGLLFCLGGDVFLALPQERAFLFGLIAFLLGHVVYVFGFFYASGTNTLTWAGALIGLAISGGVFIWLRPHLGSMKTPVLLYIFVITVMFAGAWSVYGASRLNPTGQIMVFLGALSFYFSDVFVARDRFVKKGFANRLIGLPLYYAGQFLLAFSVGLLR